MPLTSNPDAFYLSEDEFFGRFGFERPRVVAAGDGQGDAGRRVPTTAESPFSPKQKEREAQAGLNSEEQGGSLGGHDEVGGGGEKVEADGRSGVEEVVFYCKAGIRSRAAARMAREWKGVKVGDMKGGWMEWEGKGGSVQR